MYESVLVPSIFGHWATEIIERARPVGPSDRILDLGCGTGIVARRLRERLGGGAAITGIDANADMIAMAESLAPEIAWRHANAMDLPFEDGSFELLVSQQMLQFVPNPLAALREARRVLVKGGRLVLATWRARQEQPLFDLLGRIAERHLGPSEDRRFALGDDSDLAALLSEAGFASVHVEVVTRTDQFREFPFRGSAMAANYDLAALSAEELEARLQTIEAESAAAAASFASDGGIAAPSRANLITAEAP
jgi:ubiquinone/menaquinone biosynthesis C-methylase UbiE